MAADPSVGEDLLERRWLRAWMMPGAAVPAQWVGDHGGTLDPAAWFSKSGREGRSVIEISPSIDDDPAYQGSRPACQPRDLGRDLPAEPLTFCGEVAPAYSGFVPRARPLHDRGVSGFIRRHDRTDRRLGRVLGELDVRIA